MTNLRIYRSKRTPRAFGRSFFFTVAACCLFSLFACNKGADKERFTNAYTEILITREMYPDSAQGNSRVQEVLAKNGYTQQSFQQDFAEFSKSPATFRA